MDLNVFKLLWAGDLRLGCLAGFLDADEAETFDPSYCADLCFFSTVIFLTSCKDLERHEL